jgi:hypothetical protein
MGNQWNGSKLSIQTLLQRAESKVLLASAWACVAVGFLHWSFPENVSTDRQPCWASCEDQFLAV